MRTIIVTRHEATAEILRELYPDAPVLSSVGPADVRGVHVIGNLPMHLAAEAARVTAVAFASQPPRGVDLTREQIEALGGLVLDSYRVERLDAEEDAA